MSMKPEIRERIRAEMRPLVETWRTSGETRRVFADRHGISLPKFDYWVRQFGLTKARTPRGASGFAAVEVVPTGSGPGVIEIMLARGDRVTIHAGADVAVVQAVVGALAARC